MPKAKSTTGVTMEDLFAYMKAAQDEHKIRLGLLIFPCHNDIVDATFGMVVQVRNADGRVIREVTCSRSYWPSDKYTSWEAAALACLMDVYKEYEDEYLPLMQYLSRQY